MFIDSIPEEDATGATAVYYAQQREGWGYLPNYALALGHRPDIAVAWTALASAIGTGMDRRRYELVSIAAARALRNTACTVAHSMFLRDDCSDEVTLRLIVDAPDGSRLEPKDRAIYRLGWKVALDAASVEQADIDGLRVVGLSDPEIADVVYAAAARSFITRVIDGVGAQLEPQTAADLGDEFLPSMLVGRPVSAS